MHIEPGYISAAKVAAANVVAASLMAGAAFQLLRRPQWFMRALLAAAFFTLCMQAFHMKVGPSELHFIGAMPMYLLFGFVPTLLGFGLGLLMQGLLFEPTDLVHLSVNTLSLALPLLGVHFGIGRRLQKIDLAAVLKLDGSYYAGVTAMVGFWLAIGEVATPLADWARFAASYLLLVAVEPLVTVGILSVVGRWQQSAAARFCFDGSRMR